MVVVDCVSNRLSYVVLTLLAELVPSSVLGTGIRGPSDIYAKHLLYIGLAIAKSSCVS
jgi:hypothetical protein